MRLCICTLHTPEIADIAAVTVPVNRRAATRHGHDFVAVGQNMSDRPASWSKVLLLNYLLPFYDWCMWIDADAMFTNDGDPAEHIDTKAEFVVGKQFNGINCGVLFMKNCNAAYQFLDDVWQQAQYVSHPWWEQAAIADLLQDKPDRIKTATVDKPAWNRLPQDWKPGDLVLHPAGRPMAERVALLTGAA